MPVSRHTTAAAPPVPGPGREAAGLTRRDALAALLAAAGGGAGTASAQAWPERPIRFVVPYAPGGGPDILTRQILPHIGRALGQTVYAENKVGAGGLIAAEYAAQQPPDGYTWLLGSSTHVTQKLLQPKAQFDPLKSFVHVTRLAFAPSLLVVSANSRHRTLAELLAAARAEPGKLNYGSGGVGSAAHLAAAALVQQAGVQCAHIPYRGSTELGAALESGDIQFAIPTASTVVPQLQSGRLRALASTAGQRDAAWPDLPTLRELTGAADLELVAWSGLWLPAGTPPAITARLFALHRAVYAEPEVVKLHAQLGVTIALSASEAEFGAFVAAETAKLARIVRQANVVTS